MERFCYGSLYHSGVKGMKKGVRRYQNEDGTWTELGKQRRRVADGVKKAVGKTKKFAKEHKKELTAAAISGASLTLAILAGSLAGPIVGTMIARSGIVEDGVHAVSPILSKFGNAATNTVFRNITNSVYQKTVGKKRLKHSERFSYGFLYHSGRKGMHWGERNYQNPDGTWTELGKMRRRKGYNIEGRSGGVDYYRYNITKDMATAKRQGIQSGRYDEEERRIMATTYSQPPSEDVKRVAAALGLKIKTRPMSMMEDRAAVNPHYTGNNDGYSNNCMGCTLTYILRRKGLDVNAGDIPNGASLDMRRNWIQDYDRNLRTVNLVNEYNKEDNYDAEKGGHRRSLTDILEDNIKDEFKGDLNNPHYGYLGISRPQGSGHAMAWEYDPKSKSVIFMESQDDYSNAALQIERIGTGQTAPEVRFIVDPKINMEAFGEFGTAGNGQYNPAFVDKNKTSLKIVGENKKESTLSRLARDDARTAEIADNNYNENLSRLIERYDGIENIPEERLERARRDADKDAEWMFRKEYEDPDDSQGYISYKDAIKYKQAGIEHLRYDYSDGGSYNDYKYITAAGDVKKVLADMDARSPENKARVQRYFRGI